MQFKRTLLVAALSAGFILPASAHEITFLIGGLGGNLNVSQQFLDTTPITGVDVHSSGTDNNLGAEAAIGYVWNVNSGFDIGFEFFYDFVNGLEVIAPSGQKTSVDTMWGMHAMPGFNITNNTKIFFDLGYTIIDQEIDVSKVGGTGPVGFSKTNISSSTEGGFQYGAGLETMIYNTVGVRLAYAVQEGPELTLDSDDKISSFSSTPTVHTFLFGVTYHFQF